MPLIGKQLDWFQTLTSDHYDPTSLLCVPLRTDESLNTLRLLDIYNIASSPEGGTMAPSLIIKPK